MNLTQLRQTWLGSQKLLLGGLLVMVLILAGLKVWSSTQPEPAEPPARLVPSFQPADPAATMAGTVKYLGQTKANLPKRMSIVKTPPQAPITAESAKELARILGLKGVEPKGVDDIDGSRFFIFNTTDNSLSVGGRPAQISWSSSYEPKRVKPNKEEAIRLAETIISDLGLVPDGAKLVLNEEKYMEYSPIRLIEVVPGSSRANMLELIYHIELNGWPLVTDRLYTSNIRVVTTGNGRVYTLKSYLWPDRVDLGEEVEIKPLEQAIYEVETGEGTIVDVNQPLTAKGFLEVNLAGKGVSLKRAGLGYYYRFGSDIISPIYLFTGQATNKTQTAIYLPAVK